MTYIIKEWKDIKQDFRQGSLLLGNGSSIAIDSRFGYQSILQHARDNDFLTEDIQKLFDFFRTSDFELILRLVWHASKVNDALQIEDEDKRTYDA